ncbi:MAG: LuxR C-terminal-related transcriptional regulator [Spirosomataceae bacterium]
MEKTDIKLQTISEERFYEYWESKRTNIEIEQAEIFDFFRPFVETIPKVALGEYYWQIFDNATPLPKVIMVGGAVESLTPVDAETFLQLNYLEFFSFFQQDDLRQLMTFISKAYEMLFSMDNETRKNFNFSIYTRIKNRDGEYQWNSLQYPALYFDNDGNFLYGMALYTNVHHLMKPDTQPMMTILDSTSKNNQVFTCYKPDNMLGERRYYPRLTKREREIIVLLSQGKASKQISDILGISKNTVDNHRQRLLKKFQVSSSAELVIKAISAE